MEALRISVLQSNIKWESPEENLHCFEEKFKLINDSDLIVLPEMFNTGFSMKAKSLAETMEGNTIEWMKKQARIHNSAIAGSLIVEDRGNFYNRFVMVYPCTSVKHYDKRHLFRMGNEHEHYSEGKSRVIFKYQNWRIMPQVCYDLRFPVFARNRNDYDLLIYVANWPSPRREVWNTLLKARAIENQCYVLGVNRVGEDGENLTYTGDSQLINARGEVIGSIQQGEEGSFYAEISLEELQNFKEKFPAHLDGDDFRINF